MSPAPDLTVELSIDTVRATDREEIVAALETLLEAAKRGEIFSIGAVVASYPKPRDDR